MGAAAAIPAKPSSSMATRTYVAYSRWWESSISPHTACTVLGIREYQVCSTRFAADPSACFDGTSIESLACPWVVAQRVRSSCRTMNLHLTHIDVLILSAYKATSSHSTAINALGTMLGTCTVGTLSARV